MNYAPHSMARHLATYITDKSAIAAHVSREFGKRYTAADIERMLRGEKPAVPLRTYNRSGAAWQGPTPPSQEIRTNKSGNDPLVEATRAYAMKHGIPGTADAATCREAWG